MDYLNAILIELGGAQIFQASHATLLVNVQNAPYGDVQAILTWRFPFRPLGVEGGLVHLSGRIISSY